MGLHVYLAALIGGLCIGLAAALMMLTLGRITGITGIAFTGLKTPVSNTWSLMFMLGLVLGAAIFHFASGGPIPALDIPLPLLIAGGLAVGIGTKVGRGCTSGHGVCGIALFSTRSIVATCLFMATAMMTVYVRLHGGLA